MMELLVIDWFDAYRFVTKLGLLLSAPDPLEPLASTITPAKSGVKQLLLKIMTLIGIGMFLYGGYRMFFEDTKTGVIIIVGGIVLGALGVALINAV